MTKFQTSSFPATRKNVTLEEGQDVCRASSSRDLDPAMLLKDLKALQSKKHAYCPPSLSGKIDALWTQWDLFLRTTRGKLTPSDLLHNISHAFFFLVPQKIAELMKSFEEQKLCGVAFENRTFKSLGFAALQAQKWNVLFQILEADDLLALDLAVLVRSSCRKILFSSSLKDHSTRIEAMMALSDAVFCRSLRDDHGLAQYFIQAVQPISDALMKLSRVDLASENVLRLLRRSPRLSNFFESAFIHRLLRTCASHQQLPRAHAILREIPYQLQTLDHYKACMTVPGRRNPRPLLHSACSVWEALYEHPYLSADLEAYELYLSLKARLGHVEESFQIIQKMRRLGFPAHEKSYGILLQSIGRRKGLSAAMDYLPYLIGKGYQPDSYTSNILLCSRNDSRFGANQPSVSNPQDPQDREYRFVSTLLRIKSLQYPLDEVTRNLVVRAFLDRSPSHSPEKIWTLKEVSLTKSQLALKLDRDQFRRFRRPLYAMLCAAFRRAGSDHDASTLEEEWRRESRRARLNHEPCGNRNEKTEKN